MLSSKLIQLIEDRWDPITTRILTDIRADPRLRHACSLPQSDLRDRTQEILRHFGHWLTASRPDELARHFERIGGLRFEEEAPLAEVVLCYILVKDRIVDFVRSQGIGPTAMEVYAEEELEHSAGCFFDSTIYHVVRGYEEAMNEARRIRTEPKPKHAAAAAR
ncbi:MAG: hypothetical protein ABSG25_01970 [Bryobacteraceae bacterium]